MKWCKTGVIFYRINNLIVHATREALIKKWIFSESLQFEFTLKCKEKRGSWIHVTISETELFFFYFKMKIIILWKSLLTFLHLSFQHKQVKDLVIFHVFLDQYKRISASTTHIRTSWSEIYEWCVFRCCVRPISWESNTWNLTSVIYFIF